MTREEKYDLVNACETPRALADAIIKLSEEGVIAGRSKDFDAEIMAEYVEGVVEGHVNPAVLTRMYGIRQQALYLAFYAS